MSESIKFSINHYQTLKPNGELISSQKNHIPNSEILLAMYKNMILSRHVSDKAIALQRTGQLGTFASPKGQEAVYAAIGHAMQKKDIYLPNYRDIAVLLARGVSADQIYAYWGGDERGSCFKENSQDFPVCIPIATQINQAAGAAFALKYKKTPQAVLTSCGDGATSRGDFYEGLNIAGTWNLPLVVVINNNQWAISVPLKAQSGTKTLAQKGIAAGINSEQVDGNDPIALYQRIFLALETARKKCTPTLIEAITYRQADHTTSDDARRYEPKGVREDAWKNEPVSRLKIYLTSIGKWDDKQDIALHETYQNTTQQAAEIFLKTTPQPANAIFDDLYETLPDALKSQYNELMKTGKNS